MNGGGAVYHDVGSFCYSAFFPRVQFPASDAELFGLFAQPALRTCADYGLTATLSGRNDVVVGGRKIYGSAQMAWYDTFVQSGTFLVEIDFDMMAQTLKPSALKFADKSARTIYDRVTSLSRDLGYTVPVAEVESRFVANFAEEFGLVLEPGDLTLEECELAAELLRVKYSTDAWNLGERRTFGVRQAAKTSLGIVTLALDMEGDTICAAHLGGDLLLTDGGAALAALATALSNTSLTEAPDLVARADVPEEVRTALVRLLHESAAEMREAEHVEAGR
jgi:lipoate-protein ligase A